MPQFVGSDEQGNLLYQNEDGSVTPIPAGLGFEPSMAAQGPVQQPVEIMPPSTDEFAPFQPFDTAPALAEVPEPLREARQAVLDEADFDPNAPSNAPADAGVPPGPVAGTPYAPAAFQGAMADQGQSGGQSASQSASVEVSRPTMSPEEIEAYRQKIDAEATQYGPDLGSPEARLAAGMAGVRSGLTEQAQGAAAQAAVDAGKAQEVAEAAGRQAQVLEEQRQAQAEIEAEAQANWQKKMDKVQATLDAVPQTNPARIWEEGGTSTEVQGILLGFMAGFTDKPEFLDQLNNIVQTDVAAQQANADQAFRKAGAEQKMMLLEQENFDNQQAFEAGQAALRTRQIIAEIDEQMGKYAAPELQAKLADVRGKLTQQLGQLQTTVAQDALNKQHQVSMQKRALGPQWARIAQRKREFAAQQAAQRRAALAEQEERGPGFNGEALGVTIVRRDEDGNVIERRNWVPAINESHAKDLVSKAQGAYGQQRILDAMAQSLEKAGEGGGGFPWQDFRQALDQYKSQILSTKIIEGGRAISDNDVKFLEKALAAGDAGKILNWKNKGEMVAALDRASSFTKDTLQSMTSQLPGTGWDVDFNPDYNQLGGAPTPASGFTPGSINTLARAETPAEFATTLRGLQDTAVNAASSMEPDPGLASQLEAAKQHAYDLFNEREARRYGMHIDQLARNLGVVETDPTGGAPPGVDPFTWHAAVNLYGEENARAILNEGQ